MHTSRSMDTGDFVRLADAWGGFGAELPSLHSPVPQKPSDDRLVAEAVAAAARVGGELWSATDEVDLGNRLGALVELGPWPSISPLFEDLTRKLPAGMRTPTGAWRLILERGEQVFTPSLTHKFSECLSLFVEAVRIERKASTQAAMTSGDPSPWGSEDPRDVLFQADFPPTLRAAILENEAANLCAMAIVDALLAGRPVSPRVAELLMQNWLDGKGLFVLVGVGLLGDELEMLQLLSRGVLPPTAEALVEEGRKAKARSERLMSDDEPDLAEAEVEVRRELVARHADVASVFHRAARKVEHLGIPSS